MRALVALAAFGMAGVAFSQAGFPLTGRFEGWRTLTINDSEEGSTLRLDPSLSREWVVHGGPGEARQVSTTATMSPIRGRGDQWKLAGVGCYANDNRFWHLALVESPNNSGAKHFMELSEMLDGEWNSQYSLPGHLDKGSVEWQYGHTYRLTLSVSKSGVVGEVREDGVLLFRERRDFAPGSKAVVSGRPGLTASALTAEFRNLSALETDWDSTPKSSASFMSYPSGKGHFFQTKSDHGKWWLCDPADKPFLVLTTDHVNYNAHFCEALGYAPFHRNLERLYPDEKTWAKEAVARLKSWGFNSLGAGCSPTLRRRGLPYTEFLSFGAAFSDTAAIVTKTNWTGWPDVFDPRWPKFCRLVASKTCLEEKDDPWLIGYTLDNELEWFGKSGQPWGIAEAAWQLPADRAAKAALVDALRNYYGGSLSRLNQDFGTSFTRFEDVLRSTAPLPPTTEAGQKALMDFVKLASDRYFKTTVQAIRDIDSNHLVLGCRFAFDAPVPAIQAAGEYCDVVTLNIYPRVSLNTLEVFGLKSHLDEFARLTHRPLFVTEWGFPALDAVDSKGVPLPSTQGAGMRVDTQTQRAVCFRAMQTALFSHPSVVGSSFFMYADEPALGISKSFPENSNYGLVNESDIPYIPVVRAASEVNAKVAEIHDNPIPLTKVEGNWLKTYPPDGNSTSVRIEGSSFSVETRQLRLAKEAETGLVFDHMSIKSDRGWVDLGTYSPVIWLRVNGQNLWETPSHVESVERIEPTSVRVTVSGPLTRTVVDLRFFTDAPYFLARIASVQSIGNERVMVKGGYYYPLWRSDEAVSVKPYNSGIPNYWLPFGAWVSPQKDYALGAIAQQDDSVFSISFWRDTSLHADFLRTIGEDLEPKHTWHSPENEPWVAIFLAPVDKTGKLNLSGVVHIQ